MKISLTPDRIQTIVWQLQPQFRFARHEPAHSVSVEDWVSIAHTSGWTASRQRGMALFEGVDAISAAPIDGAVDGKVTEALTFAPGPHAFENYARQGGRPLFLSAAGWQDGGRRSPDVTYIESLASRSALALALPGFAPLATEPVSMDKVFAPAVYAEIRWLGEARASMTPAEAKAFGPFGPSGTSSALDNWLAISYQLFFPARVIAKEVTDRDPDATVAPSEGQWVFATALVPILSVLGASPQGQPSVVDLPGEGSPLPSVWCLYDGSQARGDTILSEVSVYRQHEVEMDSHGHPIIWVTSGTHRLKTREQNGRTEPDRSVSGLLGWSSLFSLGGAILIFLGDAIAAGTIPAAVKAGEVAISVGGPTNPVGLFLLCLALLLLLAAVIAWFVENAGVEDAPPVVSDRDAQSAPGDGIALVPAGATSNPSGTGLGAPGTTSTRAVTSGDVEGQLVVIAETYGLSEPSWWRYQGRWGVAVAGASVESAFSGGFRAGASGFDPLLISVLKAVGVGEIRA